MRLPGSSDKETDRSRTRIPALLALSNWLICITLAFFGLFLSFLNHLVFLDLLEQNFHIDAIIAVTFPTVGAVVAALRPRNAIGWIICLIGLSEALSAFGAQYAVYAVLTRPGALPFGAEVAWLQEWVWAPGFCLIATFLFLLFPRGRLLTHRWRWLAGLSAMSIVLFILPLAIGSWKYREMLLLKNPDQLPGVGPYLAISSVGLMLLALCALASIFSLILRFRRATGEERQQLKWFTYTGVLIVIFFFGGALLPVFLQLFHLDPTLPNAIDNVLQLIVSVFIPIALGIAILKHRLYDIDVIINRTLVYGMLTALLALMYFGLVTALQFLLRGLISTTNDIAIVGSTLPIAALFHPLRRRIQTFIDRRFYRRKYDAAKTLAAFGTILRNEVNIDNLSEQLVAVVQETMQPAHVSLWLRPPEPSRKRKTWLLGRMNEEESVEP